VPAAAAAPRDVPLGVLHVPDVHVSARTLPKQLSVPVVEARLRTASHAQESITAGTPADCEHWVPV
jgi:hypothetical protein